MNLNEYCIADSIDKLSRISGWCTASRDYLSTFIDINKRTVIRILQSLEEKGVLEKQGRRMRVTKLWHDNVTVAGNDKKSPDTEVKSDTLSKKGDKMSLENGVESDKKSVEYAQNEGIKGQDVPNKESYNYIYTQSVSDKDVTSATALPKEIHDQFRHAYEQLFRERHMGNSPLFSIPFLQKVCKTLVTKYGVKQAFQILHIYFERDVGDWHGYDVKGLLATVNKCIGYISADAEDVEQKRRREERKKEHEAEKLRSIEKAQREAEEWKKR